MRALYAAGLVLVACGGGGHNSDGGSDAGAGGGDAGPTDAGFTTITLSGARAGTITAPAPNCQYLPGSNLGEVSTQGDSATDHTEIDFQFAGAPTPGTYVGDSGAGISDGGVYCWLLETVLATADGWLANRGENGIPDFGTCSITLNSASLAKDNTTQKLYTCHGTITGSLAARSGAATGTINYAASF